MYVLKSSYGENSSFEKRKMQRGKNVENWLTCLTVVNMFGDKRIMFVIGNNKIINPLSRSRPLHTIINVKRIGCTMKLLVND